MNSNETPLFTSPDELAALSIIIIIFLVVILAHFWLQWQNHRRQEQFNQRLKELQAALAAAKHELDKLIHEAKAYRVDDPSPYRSLAQALVQALHSLGQEYYRQEAQLRGLAAAASPSLGDHQAVGFTADSWPKSNGWPERQQQSEALEQSIQTLQGLIRQAGAILHRLQNMPWTVAGQAGELKQVIDESWQLVVQLRANGLCGVDLNQAAVVVEGLSKNLATIPVYFWQTSPDKVIPQATKADIVKTWDHIEEVRPLAIHYRKILKDWQVEYCRLGQKLTQARDRVDALHQCLAQLPPSLLTGFSGELRRINKLNQVLPKRYRALDLAHFTRFAGTADDVVKRSNELIRQAQPIIEQYRQLPQIVEAAIALLDQIEAPLKAARQAVEYPIAWGRYEVTLAKLGQTKTRIARPPETPQQLAEHWTAANTLGVEAQALQQSVMAACDSRAQLISLLEQPLLMERPGWLKEAGDLHHQIRVYAPENWPVEAAVPSLRADARALNLRRQQLLAISPQVPLDPDTLPATVDQVRRLVIELETFQDRFQRIKDRFGLLQTLEQNAWQDLEYTYQAVQKLEVWLKEIPSFQGTAFLGLQPWKEVKDRYNSLKDQLHDQPIGLVEGKAGQVRQWASDCHTVACSLSQVLAVSIKEQERELRQEIEALAPRASLVNEEAMHQANELLRKPLTDPVPPSDDNPALQLKYLTEHVLGAQMLRSNDLARAFREFEVQIKNWVNNRIGNLEAMTEKITGEMNALRSLKMATEQDWPYLTCDISSAEHLLEQAEDHSHQIELAKTKSEALDHINHVKELYREVQNKVTSYRRQITAEKRQLAGCQDGHFNPPAHRPCRWLGPIPS